MLKKYFTKMAQSYQKLYQINGLGYLINPSTLRKEKTLIPKNFIPHISYSRIESLDIDTKEDYFLAKKLV